MTIGDPLADAAVGSLVNVDPQEVHQLIQAGMDQDQRRLEQAPEPLRSFFAATDSPPEWLDMTLLAAGSRMFFRNSDTLIGALAAGSLIEGFSTNISKSFFITGHLRDQGERRLKQNNRHMTEVFIPGGMERKADGWKMTVRIRLVHANIRRLLSQSDEWDRDAWGAPLSAAHMAFGTATFSARLMNHAEKLGVRIRPARALRLHGDLAVRRTLVWRPRLDPSKKRSRGSPPLRHRPGSRTRTRHRVRGDGSLAADISPNSHRHHRPRQQTQDGGVYLYCVQGHDWKATFPTAALPVQQKDGSAVLVQGQKLSITESWPNWCRNCSTHTPFHRFSALMESSLFDEAGISYRLPNHVYAERSAKW